MGSDGTVAALQPFANPGYFNAASNAGVLAIAVIMAFRMSKRPRYAEDAHMAWLLYWLLGFSAASFPLHPVAALLVLDAQSVCAGTFFFIAWQGEQYDHDRLLKRAVMALAVLLVGHSLAISGVSWGDPTATFSRLLAALPTQSMFTASLVMLGSIMAFRYGVLALTVLFAAAMRAVVYQPLFSAEFVQQMTVPAWWLWLTAVSTYTLAITFYWFFLTPLKAWPRKPLLEPELADGVVLTPSISSSLSWIPGLVVGATAHFLGAFVADLLHP